MWRHSTYGICMSLPLPTAWQAKQTCCMYHGIEQAAAAAAYPVPQQGYGLLPSGVAHQQCCAVHGMLTVLCLQGPECAATHCAVHLPVQTTRAQTSLAQLAVSTCPVVPTTAHAVLAMRQLGLHARVSTRGLPCWLSHSQLCMVLMMVNSTCNPSNPGKLSLNVLTV
jgi:hypothetical protein